MKITFLRTNFFWYEQQSGGSVSHIAGFVGGLASLGHTVNFIATDRLKKINEQEMPVQVVPPTAWQKRLPYLGELFYNLTLLPAAGKLLRQERPDFLYQRHSILNVVGAVLSRRLQLPLVLEYNSPEGWKLRHWSRTSVGKQQALNALALLVDALERFSLRRARLIVVVSQALQERLCQQGVPAAKILVNPNGVDLTEFDAIPLLRTHQKKGTRLIGFVGTFAHWHGAEVLCQAVKAVHAEHPTAHFILIGDGAFRPECEAIIRRDRLESAVTFTGTLEHSAAIGMLKACDILVSPHVPNPDGSPFFGSPTKLFEYMAAGKCIVASDLFQVGEIIRAHQAGLTVAPGKVADLAKAIVQALDDSVLRERLGKAARQAVEQHYTWKANAARVIEAVKPLL